MTKPIKSKKREIIEGILNLIVIFVIVFGVIRPFVGAPFKVDGLSMFETLDNGDILIVSKISYLLGTPQRGDIAVLHPPRNDDIFYVKRVIGVPGDYLSFADNRVFVDKNLLPEPYARGNTRMPSREKSIRVAPNHFFIMGDNREHSTDSRYWTRDNDTIAGAVHTRALVGRAILNIKMWDTGVKLIPKIGNFGPVKLRLPFGLEILTRPQY